MKHLYTTCGTQFQVSDEDEIFLAGFTWCLSNGYVEVSSGEYRHKHLHQIVAERMDLDFPDEIDHKDGNKLNNQRSNLRPATHSQNIMNSKTRTDNTSGRTGVTRRGNKWGVSIESKGQYIYLGRFDSFEIASEVRRKAEIKYFRDFAPGDS